MPFKLDLRKLKFWPHTKNKKWIRGNMTKDDRITTERV